MNPARMTRTRRRRNAGIGSHYRTREAYRTRGTAHTPLLHLLLRGPAIPRYEGIKRSCARGVFLHSCRRACGGLPLIAGRHLVRHCAREPDPDRRGMSAASTMPDGFVNASLRWTIMAVRAERFRARCRLGGRSSLRASRATRGPGRTRAVRAIEKSRRCVLRKESDAARMFAMLDDPSD